MKLTYQIVLVKESKKWWAYIPDLPGVYGLGRSDKEAKKDIVSALKLYLEDVLEEGETVPTSNVEKLELDYIQVAV